MKNLFLVTILIFGFDYSLAQPSAAKPAAIQNLKEVTGIISHYEPMENSALISLVGGQVVFVIKNLTSFSEEKLAKIFSSMSEGAPVVLTIIGENEVVDIQSPVQF